MAMYSEMYKGFKIAVVDANAVERVPAVITGKNVSLFGAGMGIDCESAIESAKKKIDAFPAKFDRFRIK